MGSIKLGLKEGDNLIEMVNEFKARVEEQNKNFRDWVLSIFKVVSLAEATKKHQEIVATTLDQVVLKLHERDDIEVGFRLNRKVDYYDLVSDTTKSGKIDLFLEIKAKNLKRLVLIIEVKSTEQATATEQVLAYEESILNEDGYIGSLVSIVPVIVYPEVVNTTLKHIGKKNEKLEETTGQIENCIVISNSDSEILLSTINQIIDRNLFAEEIEKEEKESTEVEFVTDFTAKLAPISTIDIKHIDIDKLKSYITSIREVINTVKPDAIKEKFSKELAFDIVNTLSFYIHLLGINTNLVGNDAIIKLPEELMNQSIYSLFWPKRFKFEKTDGQFYPINRSNMENFNIVEMTWDRYIREFTCPAITSFENYTTYIEICTQYLNLIKQKIDNPTQKDTQKVTPVVSGNIKNNMDLTRFSSNSGIISLQARSRKSF